MRICRVATGAEPVPSTRGAGVESTVHHLSVAQAALGHDPAFEKDLLPVY